MAHSVWTGGSRYTGQAALPHKNIQKMSIYPRIKRLRITLKEWLKNNKHIKTVTRDRASAYSSAIQAILPDAMQIADRFHLHQNLLEAIKNTINSVIPVDVRIPIDYGSSETSSATVEPCKKNTL